MSKVQFIVLSPNFSAISHGCEEFVVHNADLPRKESDKANYLQIIWTAEADNPCSYVLVYGGTQRKINVEYGDNWALFHLDLIYKHLRLFAYAGTNSCSPPALPIDRCQGSLLILPLAGFLNGKWCDGVCGHVYADGTVSSLMGPGFSGKLKFPIKGLGFQPGATGAYRFEDLFKVFCTAEYLRQSLVEAFRWKILQGGQRPIGLFIESFSLKNAMSLLLLRQAFPDGILNLFSRESFSDWPKPWKHLSNCLGVNVLLKGTDSLCLPSSELSKHIDHGRVNELANVLNGPSKILASLL